MSSSWNLCLAIAVVCSVSIAVMYVNIVTVQRWSNDMYADIIAGFRDICNMHYFEIYI